MHERTQEARAIPEAQRAAAEALMVARAYRISDFFRDFDALASPHMNHHQKRPLELDRRINQHRLMVETLGEAQPPGWKLNPRCACGSRERIRSVRACVTSIPLDLDTLIWSRGASFPISMLDDSLRCPRCGSRRAIVLLSIPMEPMAKRA